jgi:hypothetical protein
VELALKALAGVAILTALGFLAMGIYLVVAIASWGDNK